MELSRRLRIVKQRSGGPVLLLRHAPTQGGIGMTNATITPGTLSRARSPIAATIRRIALTGALVLTVFGLSVPAASAGESQEIDTDGGLVHFDVSDGIGDSTQNLGVLDERRDGYGVRAYLHWTDRDGPHTASVTDPTSSGKGDAKGLSILSGTAVLLSMCYIDNGRIVQCSFSQPAEA
jgi:hypothetical protein